MAINQKAKLYRKEYAFELIRIAAGDLGSARALSKVDEGRIENVCYLSQQAIEKSIKAVLCFLGKPLVLTHDIDSLIQSLPEEVLPPHAFQLGELSQYAMIRRYEEGFEIVTTEDVLLAVEAAEAVVDWAIKVTGANVKS